MMTVPLFRAPNCRSIGLSSRSEVLVYGLIVGYCRLSQFASQIVNYSRLGPPKSGWHVLWNDLVEAGILTIPDNSQARCPIEALDGVSYIVETNVSRKYRTYAYSNPQLMQCPEAKQIVKVEQILGNEFSLDQAKLNR